MNATKTFFVIIYLFSLSPERKPRATLDLKFLLLPENEKQEHINLSTNVIFLLIKSPRQWVPK